MVKTKEIDLDSIPTSLRDIKLNSLIALGNINKEDEDALLYGAFKYILGIEEVFVDGIKDADVERLYSLMDEAMKKLPAERMTFDLTIKNGDEEKVVKYGRIPNLMNATMGEVKDLDKALVALLKKDSNLLSAYDLMKVLYRPVVDEVNGLYSIVPYSEVANTPKSVFLNAPADAYLHGKAFFLNLKSELLLCTQRYIQKAKAEIQITATTNGSKKNTDGLDTLTTLLKEMSLSGIKSPRYDLSRFWISLPLMQTERT